MFSIFRTILHHDLLAVWRDPGQFLLVLGLPFLCLMLFPLGVGPGPELLARIGGGIIWVIALFATTLSLERLFVQDFEDGTLDLVFSAPITLEFVVLAKILAHWLTTALPLILVSPLLGIMMGLQVEGLIILPISLLVGTPTLTLIGATASSLLVGGRRNSIVLSLITLPLFIPVLIFAVFTIEQAQAGFPYLQPVLILTALALVALSLCPFACAASLRQAVR